MIEFPNVSPEIISFQLGPLELALRWYALAYIAGFFIALHIMKKAVKSHGLWQNNIPPLELEEVDQFFFYIVLGVIIGGRLGYVGFYNSAYYLDNPIEIFKVWNGGMSFHGGFLGVCFAAYLYCIRNGIELLPFADLLALATPPGLFLGRVANFMNAELWGAPTDVAWGVVFPGIQAQTCPGITGECARHPTQLYEALLEGLLLFTVLLFLVRLKGLKKTGLVTGVFLLGYGAARYFVELYRVADAQFASVENPEGFIFQSAVLSLKMGQILSLPMIFLGTILILYSVRK